MRQNATESNLTQAQLLTIEALSAGKTVTDAATVGGADRTTVHRWLRHDFEFQAHLNRVKNAKIAAAQAGLIALIEKAVTAVNDAIDQGNVSLAFSVLDKTGVLGKALEVASESAKVLETEDLVKNL